MVQLYSHYKRWGEDAVVIIHIYGAIAIFLLFYDDQDTEKGDGKYK